MTEFTRAAGAVARWLREQGLQAQEGWTGAARGTLTGPVAVVTVRGGEIVPGAFARYLGEGFDEETGRWRERYGRQMVLELGLDLYAPEETAQEEMGEAMDALAGCLNARCPAGLRLEKLECGELRRDKGQRVLRQEVTARFAAWLEAWAGEETEFLDFELRGGWNH